MCYDVDFGDGVVVGGDLCLPRRERQLEPPFDLDLSLGANAEAAVRTTVIREDNFRWLGSLKEAAIVEHHKEKAKLGASGGGRGRRGGGRGWKSKVDDVHAKCPNMSISGCMC